jgi:signal recognition particle receptor subunit beta
MWDDISRGAIGAVVLVDSARLADGLVAVDHFARCGMPFVVAVNRSHDAGAPTVSGIRAALRLPPAVPLVDCDVRDRGAVRDVLIELVEHATQRHNATPGPAEPGTGCPCPAC